MNIHECIENGLTIKSDLYRLSMADFKYEPEYLPLAELSRLTKIDRSTIMSWCKSRKVKSTKSKVVMVQLHSFVVFVLYKCRYKTMNSNAGKWNNSLKDRSKLAIRIRKHRGQIEHT